MHLSFASPLATLTSLSLVCILTMAAPSPSPSTAAPKYFNVTAISASEGKSTVECWQLTEPILLATDPGIAGTAIQQLGDVTQASFVAVPARFDGGLHTAPSPRLVIFMSGLAHITVPDSDDEAWIEGGKNGLIIAADTADVSDVGHVSQYPSDKTTTAIQIPFKDGKVPEHKVLYRGPCKKSDMLFQD